VRLALGPPANVAWPAHADAVRVLTVFIAHRAVMTPRSLTASGVMRCTGDMARAPENHTVGRLNPFKSVNSIQMKLILNQTVQTLFDPKMTFSNSKKLK
jgi:hypothetical protein